MGNRTKSGLTGKTRELFAGELTLPDANQYTILLDTTTGKPIANGTPGGKSAAIPTVGATRGQAMGNQFNLTIRCTGQDVTLLQYLLDGEGAWSLFASTAIVAGTAVQTVTWDPSGYGSGDALALVRAGAVAPSKIYVTLNERKVA